MLRGKPLQLVVEREAVDENGSRRVSGIGRKPGVVFFVEFDSEGFLGAAGNVVVHRWNEFGAAQLGENLLPDWFKTQVNMVQMNRRRASRPSLPKLRDRAGEQTQHAANALEVGERRRLRHERLENLGMKWVAT